MFRPPTFTFSQLTRLPCDCVIHQALQRHPNAMPCTPSSFYLSCHAAGAYQARSFYPGCRDNVPRKAHAVRVFAGIDKLLIGSHRMSAVAVSPAKSHRPLPRR